MNYQIQYKQGCANSSDDALSRRPPDPSQLFLVSGAQPSWLSDIANSYAGDTKAQVILQQLVVAPGSKPNFTLINGLLRYKSCIWLGQDPALHLRIFSAFHDSPLGGHSGFPVTYKRIRSLFKWCGMKLFIKTQVQSCLICQQAKPERVNYPGLLSPLPVPNKAWDTVTMDFISGLPPSSL